MKKPTPRAVKVSGRLYRKKENNEVSLDKAIIAAKEINRDLDIQLSVSRASE